MTQVTSGNGTTLAILTTAVAATFSGPAAAALISTAPAGFAPVTVTATSGSFSFDLDANGTIDFTLSGNGSDTLSLTEANAATSGTGSFANRLSPKTDPSSLAIGNVKSNSGSVLVGSSTGSGYTPGAVEYVELATNATFGGSYATAGTLGYMEGVFTGGDIPSFQLIDFGLVTAGTAVPEPASLALLATGAAGIAALRRRRAAKEG